MWYETLPGLSFWLNWVIVVVLLLAIVLMTAAYVMASCYAPLLKSGERRTEHVLHYYRNYAGLLCGLNAVILVVALLSPFNDRVGWVFVLMALGVVTFTGFMAKAYFAQAFAWRDALRSGKMTDAL